MYYSAIKYHDIANGSGVRTSLFVSGCRNRCEGCFQPETWNFENGTLFDERVEKELLKSLEPIYVKGLTLLGGDPFEPENQTALLPFVRKVKAQYPAKDIWAYTGYRLEEDLTAGGSKYCAATEELLGYVDVLVDGPFVLKEKDITLKFKGSANQRVIWMDRYREDGIIETLF